MGVAEKGVYPSKMILIRNVMIKPLGSGIPYFQTKPPIHGSKYVREWLKIEYS